MDCGGSDRRSTGVFGAAKEEDGDFWGGGEVFARIDGRGSGREGDSGTWCRDRRWRSQGGAEDRGREQGKSSASEEGRGRRGEAERGGDRSHGGDRIGCGSWAPQPRFLAPRLGCRRALACGEKRYRPAIK